MSESLVTAAGSVRPISRQRVRVATFVVAATLLAALYYALASSLERAGYVSANLAFLGEKAALGLHGLPPRLPNVGFVYPPLSYLLELPFPNVLIGGTVIAGILIAAVLDFLEHARIAGRVAMRIAQAYVVVSPMLLYLAVEDTSALIFALLLAGSIHFIERFLRNDYSLDLFVGSTLFGLTVFIDFRSIALLLAIVPAAALPRWRRSRSQAVSVALTIAVPTVFFALALSYVNWVFLGDPFAYIHGRGSIFRTFPLTPDLLAAAGNPLQTARTAFAALVVTLPVTLPYFVGLVTLRRGRAVYAIPATVVYASPLLFVVFAIYSGLYRPTIELLALFILVVVFSLDGIRPTRWFTAALALSFVASCVAPFVSSAPEERTFAQALIGHAPADGNLVPFRHIAERLGTHGLILMDDTVLYPLVYVSPSADRFVLPYQYGFASALSNPQAFVQYVVVARSTADEVYALYPGAEFGRLPGFHVIDRQAQSITFERDGSP
jgi:hypothetical protein